MCGESYIGLSCTSKILDFLFFIKIDLAKGGIFLLEELLARFCIVVILSQSEAGVYIKISFLPF